MQHKDYISGKACHHRYFHVRSSSFPCPAFSLWLCRPTLNWLSPGHGQYYLVCTFISDNGPVGTAGTCRDCQMGNVLWQATVSPHVFTGVQADLRSREYIQNTDFITYCVPPPTTYLGIRNKVLKNFHPLISAQVEKNSGPFTGQGGCNFFGGPMRSR